MTTLIEQIKAKIDVVEEIGLVVTLQKSGKSYKGNCPFHNERTPSFHVFAESQTWRCFGCNEGGDVFTFVEKQQGIDFRETLRYLAEKAGISIEEQGGGRDPEEERERNAARERLRKMNEEALLWYHQALLRARDARDARAYLQSRGVTSESVIAFSLGYAPDSWDGLSRYLSGRGYTEREMVIGGLARVREMSGGSVGEGKSGGVAGRPQVSPLPYDESSGTGGDGRVGGGVYDYFRNRIIFPIRDTRGRVIGFGGRAMGDGQPKYLNSPQTVLFEKNNVLYALDRARESIKLAKQVVIVEGYVDAVIAHQYGTTQTVACIGSAITEKHIQQLKSLTKQVTLALDPDAAGETATERGIQEALKAFDRTVVPVPVVSENYVKHVRGKKSQGGIIRLEEQVDAEINVAQLPPGEDPDEFIRRDFKAWSQVIAHPLPLIDYYFVAKTAGLELKQPHGKSEAAKRLLPVIGMIADRIKRDAYIQKLSSMIGIDERSLSEELQRVLRGQKTTGVTAAYTDRGASPAPGGRQILPDHRAIEQGAGDVEAGDEDGSEGQKSGRAKNRTFGLDKRSNSRVQWEDYLIGLLLANPELSTQVCGIIHDGDFAGTDTRELYRFFNSVDQRGSSPLFQSIEQAVPSALLTTIDRARKSIESRSPLDGAGLQKEAIQCATRLKRARLLQQNMELQLLMREAENAGEVEAAQQFRRQFSNIHRELRTIDSAMHLQG